jgi:hypothetical protein
VVRTGTSTPDEAAWEAWCLAEARAEEIRGAWRLEGSPMTTLGGATGKAVVGHPLLREMELAEKHAARLREVVRKKHRGPDPRAVLGIGAIGASRSSRLRAEAAKNRRAG